MYDERRQMYIPADSQDRSAWRPQRGDNAFRRGSNPFKGHGKWGHDLFEELVKTSDDANKTAVAKAMHAAVNPAAT